MQAKLLPVLRKTLRLPRLDYVSVQNQGDFLIEVPADRKDIPRVRAELSHHLLALLRSQFASNCIVHAVSPYTVHLSFARTLIFQPTRWISRGMCIQVLAPVRLYFNISRERMIFLKVIALGTGVGEDIGHQEGEPLPAAGGAQCHDRAGAGSRAPAAGRRTGPVLFGHAHFITPSCGIFSTIQMCLYYSARL